MKIYIVLLIGFLFLSCTEYDLKRVEFTRVITIGAIEVGSNSAFLIGDIENIRESSIVESGFVLSSATSEDESLRLDQPGVVQVVSPGLDTISEDRAFAARATGLNGLTEYFFRAYVRIEGEEEVAYGIIDFFITNQLSMSIQSVSRISEECPTEAIVQVQLEGRTGNTEDLVKLVYSIDYSNNLPSLEEGVIVEGGSPDAAGRIDLHMSVECNQSYFVRAVIDQTNSIPLYSNIVVFSTHPGGEFIQNSSFPGTPRNHAVSFEFMGKGYLGGGSELRNNVGGLYEYSDSEDSWMLLTGFDSIDARESVSITFDGQVLITTGLIPFNNCWAGTAQTGLDGTIYTYEQLCPACSGCIGGSLRGIDSPEPFDFGRYTCQCYLESSFLVNPVLQHFEATDFYPAGQRKGAISIEINDRSFLFGGERIEIKGDGTFEYCTIIDRSCPSDVIEISNNPFTSIRFDKIPGLNRMKLAGFAINNYGYIGLGIQCTQNCLEGEIVNSEGLNNYYLSIDQVESLVDFYSFQPDKVQGNRWAQMNPYPGEGRSLIGFALGHKGYVIFILANGEKHLWEFDPGFESLGRWKFLKILPTEDFVDTISVFTLGGRAFLYFPESRSNFWMYIPELD